MYLKSLHIHNYRMFKDVRIDFKKQELDGTTYTVFPVASLNGGGKSTLLQFIFTMLHCAFDEERQPYLANLFKDEEFEFAEGQEEIPVANFELESSILQWVSIELRAFNTKKRSVISNINLFLKELDKIQRKGWRVLEQERPLNLDNVESFLEEYVPSFKDIPFQANKNHTWRLRNWNSNFEMQNISPEDIVPQYINTLKEEIVNLQRDLDKSLRKDFQKYKDAFFIGLTLKGVALVAFTDIPELNNYVTSSVFLAAPRTQPFHFLDKDAQKKLFYADNLDSEVNYEHHLAEARKHLPNFFTNEFVNAELLKDVFLAARDEDFRFNLENGRYGDSLDVLRKGVNDFLDGINISISPDFERVIFTHENTGKELSPEQLSHGQLKRLSLFVWLKHVVKKDALVLIDEIDIALHPRWQYDISAEISEWAENSQFLLATHSPQIISANPAANTVVLQKEGETVRALSQKRREDSDINTVLHDIMGSINYRPEILKDKKARYMTLVENGKVDSDEAKKLKEFILAFEGLDSDFFQEIDFMLDPDLND